MDMVEPAANEVQLHWASLEVDDHEIERLRRILIRPERQRADRFRVPAAARRFVAARAALRLVLAQSTGVAPDELDFRFGPHGKPYLDAGSPFFNASDSGDVVVIALAPAEVGVDIELLRQITRVERLARRICTARELAHLERVTENDRNHHLLRLWTCKEAALKAVGTGLPGGVRNVEVEISDNQPPRLVNLRGDNDGWSLLFPESVPDVLCTVVVRGSGRQVVDNEFSLQST